MGLSSPWANSLLIISLQKVKKYWGLTQWAVVTFWPTLLVLLPWI